ncbi:hypothetical protein GCM10022251_59480 [Phytohabitans flavus]|uniref:Uncharacterized protein n=1 Tax=Phytohabitans flavus TaxID=1076124 RepID=A0A6F8XXT7_9ACTN|nr:hypothetical protein Pflav_050190 [Phytohabitans flavus]
MARGHPLAAYWTTDPAGEHQMGKGEHDHGVGRGKGDSGGGMRGRHAPEPGPRSFAAVRGWLCAS